MCGSNKEISFRTFRSKSWYLKHASGSTDYIIIPRDSNVSLATWLFYISMPKLTTTKTWKPMKTWRLNHVSKRCPSCAYSANEHIDRLSGLCDNCKWSAGQWSWRETQQKRVLIWRDTSYPLCQWPFTEGRWRGKHSHVITSSCLIHKTLQSIMQHDWLHLGSPR